LRLIRNLGDLFAVLLGKTGRRCRRKPFSVNHFKFSQRQYKTVRGSSLKADVTPFDIGDTVDVHTKILEGNKERIQIFSGVVIARSGSGTREMFVVRRIVAGEGVERKFPVHSPRIDKIEVKRKSVVRRAKLYFLRERSGKAVRLKERRG
jgi:large subunit ribosomal protein L19